MINVERPSYEEALTALQLPANEPLNWLIGDAIRQYAVSGSGPHNLLSLLGKPRTDALRSWNASIYQFRNLLKNAELAPKKATDDLRCNGPEVETKLAALEAEIDTPIVLGKLGFTNFSVVPPSTESSIDFQATLNESQARIEVKNLVEPMDYVSTVASHEWRKQKAENPSRYSFRALLQHSCRGPLSKEAEAGLRTIIRQFPDVRRDIWTQTLDGDVGISIKRVDEAPFPVDLMKAQEPGQLIISQSIGLEDFEPNESEIQGLFLKSLRVIVGAHGKFFTKTKRFPEAFNVIALRWNTPFPMYEPASLEYTQTRIEQLYTDFGMQLKIIIFHASSVSVPVDLIDRYK